MAPVERPGGSPVGGRRWPAMAPDASGSRQESSGAVKRGRAAGTPTGKQKRLEDAALAALLSQPTLAQAAQQAGISESTMLRWLADPAFKARYREARRQVVELAVTNLQQSTADAVDTLTRNLQCGTPASEIAAAKSIMNIS